MDFQFVYVNCTTEAEAKEIGRRLVEEKWSASASIIQNTLSYYYWEGELKEDKQVTLFLQCRAKFMENVTKLIKSMHAYDVPCIISFPITQGDAHFMDWMQRVLPDNQPLEAADGE
jgi:periplasmic divalent cation tolerance protein